MFDYNIRPMGNNGLIDISALPSLLIDAIIFTLIFGIIVGTSLSYFHDFRDVENKMGHDILFSTSVLCSFFRLMTVVNKNRDYF